MTCLIIGAWTLYVVIIIVLFRNFLISIKLKNKGVNIIQYFPQMPNCKFFEYFREFPQFLRS